MHSSEVKWWMWRELGNAGGESHFIEDCLVSQLEANDLVGQAFGEAIPLGLACPGG